MNNYEESLKYKHYQLYHHRPHNPQFMAHHLLDNPKPPADLVILLLGLGRHELCLRHAVRRIGYHTIQCVVRLGLEQY